MNEDHQSDVQVPVWFQPSWDGPSVETRPKQAGPEWPEGAVERVTFTREAFPDAAFPECLPFTEFFGQDGWPLRVPEEAKSELDVRMQAEFRREPWTSRPEEWRLRTYVRFACSYDEFLYRQAEAGVVRTLVSAGVLPQADV